MKDKGIGIVAVVIVIGVAAAATAGGYFVISSSGESGTSGTGGGGTDENDESSGTGGTTTWTPYQFEEGVHYKYEFDSSSSSGTFTWDVTNVDGDQITVDASVEMDSGQTFSQTVTGNKNTIYTKSTGLMFIAPYYGLFSYWGQGGLSVGSSWSVSSNEDTFNVKITKTKSYAGQESYFGEAKLNGQLMYEGAVAKDLGFPTYFAAYDSDTGETNFEMTLIEYSS